jgi:hypothetical protein
MATSIALKCSVSKTLLEDLDKALLKLDLEADNSLSNMRENEGNIVLFHPDTDVVNNNVSFRVPQVMKGAKSKRAKNIVEKKTKKKKKSYHEKGTYCCTYCFPFTMQYYLVVPNLYQVEIMCFFVMYLVYKRRIK